MLTEKIMQDLIKDKPEFFQNYFENGLITVVDGMACINAERFFEREGQAFISQVIEMVKEKENKRPKLTIVK